MKRRILLVDDELAVLLTLKAVLEINGFEVDTAASGREGRSKLHSQQYHMVITDMRMESDAAGAEVIAAACMAHYRPAIALLTAFPIAEEDWQALGAHKMLVKPMHTQVLLQQLEKLLSSHEAKLKLTSVPPPAAKASGKPTQPAAPRSARPTVKNPAAKRGANKPVALKSRVKKAAASRPTAKPSVKAAKP
jgi:DNA-binding response OmpR family regulator